MVLLEIREISTDCINLVIPDILLPDSARDRSVKLVGSDTDNGDGGQVGVDIEDSAGDDATGLRHHRTLLP